MATRTAPAPTFGNADRYGRKWTPCRSLYLQPVTVRRVSPRGSYTFNVTGYQTYDLATGHTHPACRSYAEARHQAALIVAGRFRIDWQPWEHEDGMCFVRSSTDRRVHATAQRDECVMPWRVAVWGDPFSGVIMWQVPAGWKRAQAKQHATVWAEILTDRSDGGGW